jgi:hypothetical protein
MTKFISFKDHEEWTKADVGIKNEQTLIEPSEMTTLLSTLKELSTSIDGPSLRLYKQIGNVYTCQNQKI